MAFGTWKIEVLGGFASAIVGAGLVAVWARNLLTEKGQGVDREMDHPVVAEIRAVVESGSEAEDARVADLHVWRVDKRAYACALSLATHDPALTAKRVRGQLAVHGEIAHAKAEIHLCDH